jgi:hypothetical protein
MADGGKVEIHVELEGGGEVQTTLNKISKQAELLGQRAKEAGESLSQRFDTMTESMGDFASTTSTKTLDALGDSFKKVGDNVGTAGGKISQTGQALSSSSNIMMQALGGVVSSVGLLTEGLGTLTTASRSAGAGFVSMMGPILILGTAVYGVIKAVKEYINTSEDLETRLEAMKAAAADYTADLEKLAEEQIQLTGAEKTRLRELTRQAKAQLEFNQKAREGEGRIGRMIEKRRTEVASIEAKIQKIREETSTEAYFLERTKLLRIKLVHANKFLAETEDKLNGLDEKAIGLLRQKNDLFETFMERGKTALAKIREEQQKAAQEIIATNEKMIFAASRFRDEAFSAEERSVSQRIARLRKELEERKRIILESRSAEAAEGISDTAFTDAQYAEARAAGEAINQALFAADEAFNAKRRALFKAARSQREAARAQEAAAEKAVADRAFTDEQNRRRALIMMQTDGFERERRLIDLRFQSAQRAATNETQLATARINQQRELMALEQKQEADRRAAEMQRIDALQRSIELTRQEAEALQMLANAPLDKVTAAVENFGQGLVFASLAALQSGESVSVAVGEALKAIALQAGVEAIMQTAKGTAALFTPGGQKVASGHFQAAAFFGAAAVAAGAAGSALSASGGGGGGASPTGAAQSMRDFDRGEDEERGGVTINVNMGQAVIYDTKAAAERAFADRVVQAINTPRRGAVRFRRA